MGSALPTFIRAHQRAVLLTFLIVLVAGLATGFMLPRGFVASTDLWLDRGPAEAGLAATGSPSARLARNTELRLLTSRDLATRTVAALGLERVRGMGQPRDGSLLNIEDAQRRATYAVQEGLSVQAIGDSYTARIRFRAERPEIAAGIANRMADLYVEERRGAAESTRRRQRLAATVAETHDALVRSEAVVEAYRSANALLGNSGRRADGRFDVAALDAELSAARADADAARVREARTTAAATPRIRDLKRRQTQRAVEEDAASNAIEKRIVDQQRRLASVERQSRLAEARVRLLSRIRERGVVMVAEGRRIEAELARLATAAAGARERYTQAKAALDQDARAEARHGSTAYVISRSSAESARREPGFWIIVLGALASAAAAAALVGFALELRHKGFRSAAALERALGIKVLAMIPELSELRSTAGMESRVSVADYLMREPVSELAEAFRKLLAALRAGGVRQAPLVVAISSALPDEGKTTVAICLARSAALNGLRTVLVDCDVRRPAASRALLPMLAVGLIDVLEDGAELSETLQHDPGSDAFVLGIGSKRQARTFSLDPQAMRPLIEQLKQDFDMIVCDTPPALALSEAREAAALADAVLLVVRHRETPTGAVTIAQDLLKRAGARMRGAVLTMVNS